MKDTKELKVGDVIRPAGSQHWRIVSIDPWTRNFQIEMVDGSTVAPITYEQMEDFFEKVQIAGRLPRN